MNGPPLFGIASDTIAPREIATHAEYPVRNSIRRFGHLPGSLRFPRWAVIESTAISDWASRWIGYVGFLEFLEFWVLRNLDIATSRLIQAKFLFYSPVRWFRVS